MRVQWAFLLAAMVADSTAAANVSMAFGDNLPPFILVQSKSGIELDVIREALALRGHVLQPHFVPMGRLRVSFIERQVDALMLDVDQDLSRHGGHYGAPPVLYDNVFITLKDRGIAIRKSDDLAGLSIVAFVGAAQRYPGWLGAISQRPGYVERNNQSAQPLLLVLGHYDAVLSDRIIFKYYVNQQKRSDPRFVMPAIDEHAFVRPAPDDYRPVFRDPKIRDDFNAGLEKLRKSGRYQAIYDSYLTP